MKGKRYPYYPTVLGAAHLVILYLFIQTVVDFPLAVWDYFHGTEYLSNPFKNIVLQAGSILFIIYYGYRKANTRLSELFPVKRFNLVIMIPVTLSLMGTHVFLGEVNMAVDRLIPAPSWFLELFDRLFENDYGIYGTFLKVVVIAPVIEELIFRGIIMHGFMRNYPKVVAILVSALFFALFHLNPWQFPATILLGLLLGWVMVITRNIFACMAGHAINNLLVLLSIQHWESIRESSFFLLEKGHQLKISYFVVAFSLAVIGLFAVKRKKS
ncbi:MAG: CPBP family intramembrane metalloprotease [Mangrovibacterium sp.]|nr:CPBP family intramembrane metalloprotease [Mangrovibacterium sp.]